MNNRKKQTVAVAMATALGVSSMMSPVAVQAQEENPATTITQESNPQDSVQEIKPQDDMPEFEQAVPMFEQSKELSASSVQPEMPIIPSRAIIAFTDYDKAEQAIRTALDSYLMSNETTLQDIQAFLDKEFVDTGKLKEVKITSFTKIEEAIENFQITIIPIPIIAGDFPEVPIRYSSMLLSLPKTGEVYINTENFPDDTFRQYISNNFDLDNPKDNVLSMDEINKVKSINVAGKTDIVNLKGIEYFTALTYLNCSNTGIKDLNVSNHPNLIYLYCYNTGIIELNVDNNPDLSYLYCSDTGIDSLNLTNNPALIELKCQNTNIKKMDVSNNHDLKSINCSYTDIIELNVSNNPALTYLNCSDTGIDSLNISKNFALTILDCANTGISSLDISHFSALTRLNCSNTKINSLDVSNHPKLTMLDCSNTPLVFLNLGTGHDFSSGLHIPTSSSTDITVSSDSLDMTQISPNIDSSKIHIHDGAILKDNKLSDYHLNTPVTYTYECGTDSGRPITLDVTLNLKKTYSTISIVGNLDTSYTGEPIKIPPVQTNVSNGTVTYSYEVWNGSAWEVLNSVPINVGIYQVQAHLAGDEYKTHADSAKAKFTIKQAKNEWTIPLEIKGWTFGEKSNTPEASPKYGNIIFTYSDSRNGTYTDKVPYTGGTWYVKASVQGAENYTGLEQVEEFIIAPAKNEWTAPLEFKGWTFGEKPNIPEVNSKYGNAIFTYSDSRNGIFTDTVPTTAGTWYVKVSVAGTENYTGSENILSFVINPKIIKSDSIRVTEINNDVDLDHLIIKDNGKELVKGTDYDVSLKKEGNKVIVTITFKGQYTGVIVKTYREPSSSQDSKKSSESVKTSDSTQTGLFATLSILSVGCIAFLTSRKRKKNIKEDESIPR